MGHNRRPVRRQPCDKGKLVGQKGAPKVKDIGAIRVRLQIQARTRDLALFDLGMTGSFAAATS